MCMVALFEVGGGGGVNFHTPRTFCEGGGGGEGVEFTCMSILHFFYKKNIYCKSQSATAINNSRAWGVGGGGGF